MDEAGDPKTGLCLSSSPELGASWVLGSAPGLSVDDFFLHEDVGSFRRVARRGRFVSQRTPLQCSGFLFGSDCSAALLITSSKSGQDPCCDECGENDSHDAPRIDAVAIRVRVEVQLEHFPAVVLFGLDDACCGW